MWAAARCCAVALDCARLGTQKKAIRGIRGSSLRRHTTDLRDMREPENTGLQPRLLIHRVGSKLAQANRRNAHVALYVFVKRNLLLAFLIALRAADAFAMS